MNKFVATILAALGLSGASHAEEPAKVKLFDIALLSFSDSKIMAIKVVRIVNWVSLTQAKAWVESTPTIVKEGVTKDEGEIALKAFEAVKCKAELRDSKVTSAERYELVLKRFDEADLVRIAATVEIANGWHEFEGEKALKSLPLVVKKSMTKDEAARMKLSFDDMNAEVEVKDSGK